MTGRTQVTAEGNPTAVLAQLADFIGSRGARTFELEFDVLVDGQPTELDEPGPEDSVQWRAIAKFRRHGRRYEYVGEHLSPPGGRPDMGALMATVDLVEKLGGNVVLVDMTDGGGG